MDLQDGGIEALGAEDAVKHAGVHLEGHGVWLHRERRVTSLHKKNQLSGSGCSEEYSLRGWDGIL